MKKVYSNGDIYEGKLTLFTKKRTGQGKMIYKNGDVYEGEWEDDLRHGYGKMTYKYNGSYEGMWANDKFHGKGIRKLADGTVYDGAFYNGEQSGHGKTVVPGKYTHEGEYRYGYASGKGWQTGTDFEKGVTYRFDGMFEGGSFKSGKINYSNKDWYNGQFKGGKPFGMGGQGRMTLKGGIYEGSIVYGKPGAGTLTAKDGTIYKGAFKDGELNGEVKVMYPDKTTGTKIFVNGVEKVEPKVEKKTEQAKDIANDQANVKTDNTDASEKPKKTTRTKKVAETTDGAVTEAPKKTTKTKKSTEDATSTTSEKEVKKTTKKATKKEEAEDVAEEPKKKTTSKKTTKTDGDGEKEVKAASSTKSTKTTKTEKTEKADTKAKADTKGKADAKAVPSTKKTTVVDYDAMTKKVTEEAKIIEIKAKDAERLANELLATAKSPEVTADSGNKFYKQSVEMIKRIEKRTDKERQLGGSLAPGYSYRQITVDGISGTGIGNWIWSGTGYGAWGTSEHNRKEGEWKNFLLNGEGTSESLGVCYVGEFLDGKPRGITVITDKSKDTIVMGRIYYDGEVIGVITNKKADNSYYYEGKIKNFAPSGGGVLVKDNRKLCFQFVNGHAESYGKCITGKETFYGYYHSKHEGNIGVVKGEGYSVYGNVDIDFNVNGIGIGEYENGTYIGYFKNTFRHGYGIYKFSDGDVYEGDFVDGKRTGKGKLTLSDGVYEGDFVEGKRTGKGKLIWSDGDVYEGDFVNNERHGYGKYTYASGKCLEGKWENGKFIDNNASQNKSNAINGVEEKPMFEPEFTNGGITFADVAGLDEVKEQIIFHVLEPMKNPELAKAYGIKPGGKILLYGPPGTGKTLIARAIAGEIEAAFYAVSCQDLISKWIGESSERLNKLFDETQRHENAIIFFDEFDSVAGKRDGIYESKEMARFVATFLTKVDGFKPIENKMMLLIAATNRPWALDSAMTRGGRFDTQIYVGVPDKKARDFLVNKSLGKLPLADDVSLDELSDRFEGFGGGDITAACDKIRLLAYKRSVRMGGMQNVTLDDCNEVLSGLTNNISAEELARFEAYKNGESIK